MLKKLYAMLMHPIQVTRTEAALFNVRPVVVLLLLAALLATTSYTAIRLKPSSEPKLLQQIAHMKHEHSLLGDKLTETEARLALRDSEIDGMKAQMQTLRQEKTEMQRKLGMFNDVLAARKVKGVHLLQPRAEWRDDHSIDYSLVVVKGNNYPRWIKGRVIFVVSDKNGSQLHLLDSKGRDSVKVEMTTQMYLEGSLVWPHDWQPESLKMVLIDHYDHIKAESEINLNTGKEQARPETEAAPSTETAGKPTAIEKSSAGNPPSTEVAP